MTFPSPTTINSVNTTSAPPPPPPRPTSFLEIVPSFLPCLLAWRTAEDTPTTAPPALPRASTAARPKTKTTAQHSIQDRLCSGIVFSLHSGLPLDDGRGHKRRVTREQLAAGGDDHVQAEREPEQPEEELLETRVRRLLGLF